MIQYISILASPSQTFVDRIGMYRIVSGTLGILATISIFCGFVGWLPYSGFEQLQALIPALIWALLLNHFTATASKISGSPESTFITTLILFFLVVPGESFLDNWPLFVAVTTAIMSKYVLVYRKQHFLNPAAVGAVAVSLPGFYVFSWWIGNPTLFIPLLLLGILVVMKIRKWTPVLWFVGVGLATYIFEAIRFGDALLPATQTFFLSWPTLFLAFFMLTEPFTMPPRKWQQAGYGALVGFLSNTALFIPFFAMSPELALVIGNILVAPLRLSQKLFLQLEEKKLIAKDTYEFVFKKPKGFTFVVGQYLEWMLPHEKYDNKGTRRYFTIASSPTESQIRVALKITEQPSSYKAALQRLDSGGVVVASQLAGDFVLPKDTSAKLGFIAGGIGVTPFRSHVRHMVDSGKTHDTVLYYCNNTKDEIAYGGMFSDAAKKFPFSLINVISKESVAVPFESGYVTADMIRRRSPDYLERTWYISGPPGMVNAYKKLLLGVGVSRSHIKTDFFPGTV